MARFPLSMTVKERPCGGCQECCHVAAVAELKKPQWQACAHQCEQGCAIYAERPESCQVYSCLWAAGMLEGDERRRPDKLGVIFDLRTDGEILLGERSAGDTAVVQVMECKPGALDEPAVEWIMNRIADRYPLALRRYGSQYVSLVDRKGALR